MRHPKLATVIHRMEAAIEEPVSPAVLAQDAGMSTRQLERLFRRYLGKSPKRYYMELRLAKARNLLMQTDMSVINVALACGFTSPSHFSKCYRALYKTTPYRERGASATPAGGLPVAAFRSRRTPGCRTARRADRAAAARTRAREARRGAWPFTGGAEGFRLRRRHLRLDAKPGYASGIWCPDGDGPTPAGAARLARRHRQRRRRRLSGGWRELQPQRAPRTCSRRTDATQSNAYESNEYSEVPVAVDGQVHSVGVRRRDGYGGPERSTGWRTVSGDLGDSNDGQHG